MRPLTEQETVTVLTKLKTYLGRSLPKLLDSDSVLRFHKERIYYVRESLDRAMASFPRKEIVGAGICLGKVTKSRQFRLHITALSVLARFAKIKVWVKPAGEQAFLYGNSVLKASVIRMTQDGAQGEGCVVFSSADLPLGFGVLARSSEDVGRASADSLVVIRQADVGEFLRSEIDL